MEIRGKRALIYNAAFVQIFLLIMMSFAVAVMLSKEAEAEIFTAVDRVTGKPIISAPPSGANIPTQVAPIQGPTQSGATLDTVASTPATPARSTGAFSFIGKISKGDAFKKVGTAYTPEAAAGGALVQGVFWGALMWGAAKVILPMVGASEATTTAVSNALLAAGLAGGVIKAASLYTGKSIWGMSAGQAGFWGGLGVGVLVFLMTYKDDHKETVKFECLPWEPKLGGADCERCNDDPFRACTEYRCRSLGQTCRLLNPSSDHAMCANIGRNDVNTPMITPKSEVLAPKSLELKYVPDTSIRPPNIGVKILSNLGSQCLPAFTPLQFGFDTDEPAQCKIDYNHTNSYDEMQFYVGESNYYTYNHTQVLKLPGSDDIGPILQNDGTFQLFVRCRDGVEEKNGNAMIDEYVFKFCVDDGPDTSPPIAQGFSVPSGSYIQFDKEELNLDMYVNEPAECKWSPQDKDYETMENDFTCGTETYMVNSELNYVCSATLNGIQNREENQFFFRCVDQPDLKGTDKEGDRNPNRQSISYTVLGSRPLDIIDVKPNGTILGSTDVVSVDLTVETSNGAQGNGNATCYISSDGTRDSFIEMYETNSYRHNQTYNRLVAGYYEFFFRCIDAGGNVAESNTNFTVEVDKSAPLVTRAYRNKDALQIITDEDAECVYATSGSCNYNIKDGIKMQYFKSEDKTSHLAEWKDSRTYYIKCTDLYENQPDESKCNIVVRAMDLEKEFNSEAS